MLHRILLGGLAGIVGTAAMTAAMWRLHRRLPDAQRYPLPPREIVARMLPDRIEAALPERGRQDLTLAAHFGYGAAAGAVYALGSGPAGPVTGASYGVVVWAASYLGWIPAVQILKPATRHPAERDALMIAVHLVWGATMALALGELERAEREIFAEGPLRDAPGQPLARE